MERTAWLLLSKTDLSYGGNAGYEDVISERYLYDNSVPNHKNLKAGDLAVIAHGDRLLGLARIEAIEERSDVKKRYRCPECDLSNIWERKRPLLRYRCKNGHEFDEPWIEEMACTTYQADFGHSFVDAADAIPVQMLRRACPTYNQQLSMQRIDLTALTDGLVAATPAISPLLRGELAHPYLTPYDGDGGEGENVTVEEGTYAPSGIDTREQVERSIKMRRGQRRFRLSLLKTYSACMVSGCVLVDLLEAAHIQPYRGERDNHDENGLLLRADLHTLFDLDLLGIEPLGLTVHLHPSARAAGYAAFEGVMLRRHGAVGPSRPALETRWPSFLARLNQS